MKKFLIVLVAWMGFFVGTPADALVAPMYYNPTNGNLTLDTTLSPDGEYRSYLIKSAVDGFLAENHSPYLDTSLTVSLASQLGEANIASHTAGVYSLGDVMPVGLSDAEANDFFLGNPTWTGTLGAGVNTFELVYGPSPFTAMNDPNPSPLPTRWATEIALTYNPSNGMLTLDSTGAEGGAFVTYQIKSSDGSLFSDQFNPIDSLSYQSSSFNEVAEAHYGGFDSGVYELGQLLSPGLTFSEVESLLSSAVFLGEPGHGVGDLDLETSGFAFSLHMVSSAAMLSVPEPSSLLLGSLGFLGLISLGIQRRRKRRA